MGFFEKFFKKKTAPAILSSDKAVAESKPELNVTITTKQAPEERKPEQIPENKPKAVNKEQNVEYTFELFNGDYYIYKNDKEFFNSESATIFGEYILAAGWSGNSQAIAFFTMNKLIAIRKTEALVEEVKILPSGMAFVFTDEDNLIIMSESGTASKKFAYGSASANMRVSSDDVCAYVEDEGEFALLKCYNFALQSIWSKKINYNLDDDVALFADEPTLHLSGDVLEVVTPDGCVSRLSFGGELLKE